MDCPVTAVGWDDVQTFIKKLNTLSGKNYRLPTEAEWDYAARGGTKSKKFEYAGSNDINAVAWTSGNSGSNTYPVGQKEANELGLYDMSGNVWEWCNDWYDENYYGKSPENDPKGPATGPHRVIRGGNWSRKPAISRVTYRNREKIGYRFYRVLARFFPLVYRISLSLRLGACPSRTGTFEDYVYWFVETNQDGGLRFLERLYSP